MMIFSLSQRSLNNLRGVDDRLVQVVHRAIEVSTIDFAVIEGLRSAEKQMEYYNKGASQIAVGGTHCEGRAVDLMAIHDGQGSWDLTYYDDIAEAMRTAAIELNVGLRWGSAWHISDIRDWNGSMQAAITNYVETRRKQGQKPFIDAVHFELSEGQ